jgi:hypothetical protein
LPAHHSLVSHDEENDVTGTKNVQRITEMMQKVNLQLHNKLLLPVQQAIADSRNHQVQQRSVEIVGRFNTEKMAHT